VRRFRARRARRARSARSTSGRRAQYERAALVLGLGLIATAVLGACGRRATELDCQLIVDKSVELELRQAAGGSETSPDAIKKREEQVRGELQDEIKSCEGKRVTDQTMACVHAARTTEELDACLR
jgi:hypothetical protein